MTHLIFFWWQKAWNIRERYTYLEFTCSIWLTYTAHDVLQPPSNFKNQASMSQVFQSSVKDNSNSFFTHVWFLYQKAVIQLSLTFLIPNLNALFSPFDFIFEVFEAVTITGQLHSKLGVSAASIDRFVLNLTRLLNCWSWCRYSTSVGSQLLMMRGQRRARLLIYDRCLSWVYDLS